jgi:hypothetical protein
MVTKTIYIKTAKGKSEGANLSGDLKRLLGFIDGSSLSDELAKRAPPSLRKNWNKLIGELVAGQFIVQSNNATKEERAPLPKSLAAEKSVGKTVSMPTEVGGGNSPHAASASNAVEHAAEQKTEKSGQARAELKAFFATAKVKADAEAKAAREEAKAQELEKAARAKAEAEHKEREQAAHSAQAEIASNAADLLAKQKAEKAARVRAELEEAVAIAKVRTNADVKAKADAKARQEIEKATKAKVGLEAKVLQEEAAKVQVESAQISASLAAKWKAEETSRIRAELEVALEAAKARLQAENAARAEAEAETRSKQEAEDRKQVELAQIAAEVSAKRDAEVARIHAELEAQELAARASDENNAWQEAENTARSNAEVELRLKQESEMREQVNAEIPVADSGFLSEFSDASFYIKRAQSGGLDESEVRRLRDLENENNKLKQLLAEAHLEIQALRTTFGVKR